VHDSWLRTTSVAVMLQRATLKGIFNAQGWQAGMLLAGQQLHKMWLTTEVGNFCHA
jgi:hypothetical protein